MCLKAKLRYLELRRSFTRYQLSQDISHEFLDESGCSKNLYIQFQSQKHKLEEEKDQYVICFSFDFYKAIISLMA